MKHGLPIAACLFALAAGAQQHSDKPSPVPRKTVRPAVDSAPPGKSRQASPQRSEGDRRDSSSASGSERPGGAATLPQSGIACFFSSSANGGLTASGSRLNSEELMAGHARLPLGSWIRVENLANGKTADVQIVDRFPDTTGRIINVSEAAARQLGFVKAGTAEVKLTPVGSDSAKAPGGR
jgi:rare lipoprotein A